jgi:hypothetical protein
MLDVVACGVFQAPYTSGYPLRAIYMLKDDARGSFTTCRPALQIPALILYWRIHKAALGEQGISQKEAVDNPEKF